MGDKMSDGMEFAGKNPFTDSPNNSLRAIYNISKDDFGRESLGIVDLNNPDFGRESLSFLRDDLPRESLGIINLNNLDIGRESLGITNIKTYDFVISNVNLPEISEDTLQEIPQDVPKITSSELPDVLLFKDENSNSVTSTLNRAFLQLPKLSVSSSVSSVYPSFNSASLESSFPSRIFSASTSSRIDIMNDAFDNTSDFIKRFQLLRKSTSSTQSNTVDNLNKSHLRIKSLPSTLESKGNTLECNNVFNREESEGTCAGDSFAEIANIDDKWSDSVFIEAQHIASRIADGSFLEPELENDMLDSIQEPEDLASVSIDNEEPKCDTETVFKNVDKMFIPCDIQTVNLNPPDKSDNSEHNTTKSSSTKSKSAIDIINSLSEILSSDNPSRTQKSEGQNLLNSLADILLSSASTKSRSCILDDSGHSSIESEPVALPEGGECYEVLDLRKKSSSETNINEKEIEENCVPLDLSLKSKSACGKTFISPKFLPPKFTRNEHKLSIYGNKSLKSFGSTASLSSNDSRNSGDLAKFRPKKCDDKVTNARKGPMKAVLPVDNMARRKSGGLKITPTRAELKPPSYKKKTSTPINESNMKPMAQSTPDNPRMVYPTSPLARPNASSPKTLKQKLNYSGSHLPLNTSLDSKPKPYSLLKRGSSGELKKPQNTQKLFVRSYSLGDKSRPFSRTKDKIEPQKNSVSKTENKPVLRENRSNVGVVRTSISKKLGKENLQARKC